MTRPPVPWQPDLGLFEWVNDLARRTPLLHAPMRVYAAYGVVLFGALLVAGWWRARRRSSRDVAASLWAGAATLLAVALNQPLVGWVNEPRPYTVLPDLLVLASRSADPSFPSDHSVMAGAVAAGLLLVSRRLGAVAVVAALVLAAARVYTAAHWPHDVVVGLLFGALVTAAGWWAVGRGLTALVERLRQTPIRPLLLARS